MPVLDAQIQVRPVRVALILPPGCSKRTFGDAVENLCSSWGGIYSLMIPADEIEKSAVWERLLEIGDPDIVAYHPLARTTTQHLVDRLIRENRLCPQQVTQGIKHRFPSVSLAAALAGEVWIEAMVDARAGGSYSFGDASKYEVLRRSYARLIGRVSARQYARLKAKQTKAPPESVISLCGKEGALRRTGGPVTRVLFLGDEGSLADACAFWSLRATIGSMMINWLTPALSVDDWKPPYVLRTAVAAYSLAGSEPRAADLNRLARELQVRKITVAKLESCLPSESSWLDWSGQTEPVALEGSELVLSRRAPDIAGSTRGYKWAMEVSLRDAAGCSSHGLQPLLHPSVNSLLLPPRKAGRWQARVCRTGITVTPSGSRDDQVVRLRCPQFQEVIAVRAKAAGLALSLSDKGVYSAKSVELMGGVEKLASLMRDSAASAILDEFMIDHHSGERLDGGKLRRRFLTVEDMIGAVLRRSQQTGKKVREKERKQTRENVVGLVAALLEKGVLQPGAIFDCRACRAEEWYHAREFDESFVCRRCLEKQSCGPSPDWRYRLHESVFQGYVQHMRAPIMALDSLRSSSQTSFVFMSEAVFTYKDGKAIEVDILACQDGKLSLGEAKSGSHISGRSLAKYEQIAKDLGVHALVFATSEKAQGGCIDMTCEQCPSADEAFSHGDVGTKSHRGTREMIGIMREKLAKTNIAVDTLCRDCLESGCRWEQRDGTRPRG